jgi:uncharacterized phage protein (TIGR01671 family)
MSRELKFRVWSVKNNCFVTNGCSMMSVLLSLQYEGAINLKDIYQQYTGLTDKNKKEIYEGDVLDFTARYKQTGPVEVIYYGASFGCVVTDDGGLKEFWDLSHIVQQHYPEIIGNIFENQELLKTI